MGIEFKHVFSLFLLLFTVSAQGQITEEPITGNVGIGGSSSTSYKLNVDGEQRINSGSETNSVLKLNNWHTNQSKFKGSMLSFTTASEGRYGHFKFINASDVHGIKFSVGSQGNLYTAGNVGIGISSPQAKLHVFGAGEQVIIGDPENSSIPALKFFGGHNTGYAYIQAGGSAPGKLRITRYQTTSASLDEFQVYSSISSFNGFVGIGTNSPESKLHLKGDGLSFWISRNTYRAVGSEIGIDFRQLTHNGSLRTGGAIKSISTNSYYGGNGSTYDSHLVLYSTGDGDLIEGLRIDDNGNVGIGTTTPDELLTVNGTIHSSEVRVDLDVPAPDYVFSPDYQLSTLEETAAYIEENHHLPEIPSAAEMEANGVELGEMNMLLLKKIEELTLHMIELKKENQQLKEEQSQAPMANSQLANQIEELTLHTIEQEKAIKTKEERLVKLESQNEALTKRLEAIEQILSER
ncbi:tropomyosin [Reichenbachiella ulvae]|uniref:Tropomyosin n=1 Tax=Reichenbachiella ulvae TaxID=2980104 RepID=A0ABT3CV15_9BACT|nr:tropomyosin [Reichenbachiella ulvae]MCV9387442.1 tropomyosin [Reichenbachiella ulvae]